jgi:uncharacterized protein
MPELDVPLTVLVVFAAGSSLVGTLGGLGGAIFLVPLLILAGVEPVLAVPLGATSVVAGSLAAGPTQLGTGLVHHRIGISIEVLASLGAVVGAVISDVVSGGAITVVLAVVALGAAVAAARPSPQRNLPEAMFLADDAGEWPGTLAGAYRLGDEVVPYQAKRVPVGLSLMSLAGVISGLAGVGGGFIKVPIMREIMHVPVKVAAATSTFTVGMTSAVSLVVFARQGRIDTTGAAAVMVGAIAGGLIGPHLAARLDPQRTRKFIAVLLAIVAVVLLVRR